MKNKKIKQAPAPQDRIQRIVFGLKRLEVETDRLIMSLETSDKRKFTEAELIILRISSILYINTTFNTIKFAYLSGNEDLLDEAMIQLTGETSLNF